MEFKKSTKWAALDLNDGITIVSEGTTPEEAINKAGAKPYILMFVPQADITYIF